MLYSIYTAYIQHIYSILYSILYSIIYSILYSILYTILYTMYTDLDKIIGTPGIFVSSLTLALNFSLAKPNVFRMSFLWIVPLLVCNIA